MRDKENFVSHRREFISRFYEIWMAEQPFHHAPGLAYYLIFSIVPIIYISLSVVTFFIDEIRAQSILITRVNELLGEEAAQLLEEALLRVEESLRGGSPILSAISFIALILTASLFFFQLQYVLNSIWKVPPPKRGGTKFFFEGRLLAFLIVLGIGGTLTILIVLQLIITWLGGMFPLDISLPFTSELFLLVLGTLTFAMIYKVLPNAEISWRDVWVGSFVTALLFWVGARLLLWYLTSSSLTSPEEAMGVILVSLLAFYFLALIFVFGAVFTRVYSSMYGSKIVPQFSTPPETEDNSQ